MIDYIEFTLNVGCLNKCKYCPQELLINSYKGNITQMNFWVFRKCLENLPKNFTIIFGGMSEPFQNPQITRMITYAYQQGYKIGLYTTLNHYYEKISDELKNIEFQSVRLHLPDDNCIMQMKINNSYLRNLIKFIQNTKIRDLVITDMVNDDKIMCSRAGNLPELLDRDKPKNFDEMLCIGKKYPNGQIVLPNGDVVICCHDYGLKHIVGNLVNDDFETLWKNIVDSGLPNKDAFCNTCNFASDAMKECKDCEVAK